MCVTRRCCCCLYACFVGHSRATYEHAQNAVVSSKLARATCRQLNSTSGQLARPSTGRARAQVFRWSLVAAAAAVRSRDGCHGQAGLAMRQSTSATLLVARGLFADTAHAATLSRSGSCARARCYSDGKRLCDAKTDPSSCSTLEHTQTEACSNGTMIV